VRFPPWDKQGTAEAYVSVSLLDKKPLDESARATAWRKQSKLGERAGEAARGSSPSTPQAGAAAATARTTKSGRVSKHSARLVESERAPRGELI